MENSNLLSFFNNHPSVFVVIVGFIGILALTIVTIVIVVVIKAAKGEIDLQSKWFGIKSNNKNKNKNQNQNQLQNHAQKATNDNQFYKVINCANSLQQELVKLSNTIATYKNQLLEDQMSEIRTSLSPLKSDIITKYTMGTKNTNPDNPEKEEFSRLSFEIKFSDIYANLYENIRTVIRENHLKERNEESFSDLITNTSITEYKLMEADFSKFNNPIDCALAQKILHEIQPNFENAVKRIFYNAKKCSINTSTNLKNIIDDSYKTRTNIIKTNFPEFSDEAIMKSMSKEV